ncbi:IS4 family transposase [uncultured Duncaniella sp.]|uniref:IS4 family transposase n=1 Tax=uncultured Duncaniella sp. TaxID=2768039 RepID=UPI0025B7A786|nr:IS4 family transposase [uncultured Duncaniella sp.]
MSKSSNFFGQPIYGQLIKSLNREKIVEISRKHGGEKYIKSFDGFTHLLTMLYAVIQRFDSLREIETAMTAEVRKLHHVGIKTVPRRSTLSDANARRPESFFEEVYRYLYDVNKGILSSDSRRNGTEKWMKQLRIIDSTTITLFSNAIFRGVGRHPKTGKKKGGIKVHSVLHANEGVPCDVRFTSAATNDSFMLAPSHYRHDEIQALDRAYINYAKFEELTDRSVVYVTKMKKNLCYEILVDCMHQNSNGLMEYREQIVVFRKDGINHIARIITYVDIKKGKKPKLISLLTNDFDMPLETIVAIYRRRWQIESLFKQIKQNFPLRYFYGESANAIKIQIWVTLIANLLLSVLQNKLTRRWSFSGLATMVRIVLMYYLNLEKFLNQPDADLKIMLADASESPPEETEN